MESYESYYRYNIRAILFFYCYIDSFPTTHVRVISWGRKSCSLDHWPPTQYLNRFGLVRLVSEHLFCQAAHMHLPILYSAGHRPPSF